MTDVEHAKKYAEESTSLVISMYNPMAEKIAEFACLYGLTYKNKRIAELEELLDCKNCCELDESECGSCAEFGHFRCKGKAQLTEAKDHIKKLLDCLKQDTNDPQTNYYVCQYMDKAEQFLKDCEVEK